MKIKELIAVLNTLDCEKEIDVVVVVHKNKSDEVGYRTSSIVGLVDSNPKGYSLLTRNATDGFLDLKH